MKKLSCMMIAAATMLVLTGCGGGALSGGGNGEGSEEELYIFLPKSLDNPYWDDAREGMQDRAEELGVDAEFLGPEEADAAEQVSIFENAISRNPAGIAVSANDPETVRSTVEQARSQDIPVVAWDSEIPDSEVQAYVGTDNVAAGQQAGEALAEVLGGEGRVAVLSGSLTALNAQQRLEGFEQALEEYPDIEITTTETTGESVAGATSTAENVLQSDPEMDALFGVTGADAPGAGNAVQQSGRCDDVVVAGFDVVSQGIGLMEDGCIQALVSQRPYGMTVEALDLLQSLHEGEEAEEENVDTGVITVFEDDLEEFLEEAPH